MRIKRTEMNQVRQFYRHQHRHRSMYYEIDIFFNTCENSFNFTKFAKIKSEKCTKLTITPEQDHDLFCTCEHIFSVYYFLFLFFFSFSLYSLSIFVLIITHLSGITAKTNWLDSASDAKCICIETQLPFILY